MLKVTKKIIKLVILCALILVFCYVIKSYINPLILLNQSLVSLYSNILVAIGTLGAVIVALYLSYKGGVPKLKPYAYIAIKFPENVEYLCLSCVNTNKQPVICSGLVLTPNKYRHMRMLSLGMAPPSVSLPHTLQYSETINQYYLLQDFLNSADMKKEINKLSKHRWLARLQLNLLWRVIATTYIAREFENRLSSSLVEKILSVT